MASADTYLILEVCVDLMHTSVFCNDGRMTGKTAEENLEFFARAL